MQRYKIAVHDCVSNFNGVFLQGNKGLMSFKLLIIRFSSIGDIVLTTPVIRCVHEQIDDVEIHYVTKKRFASIVESNPFVTKVYSFSKSLSEVLPDLKKEKYDHIIDLHKNLRSFRVLLSLWRPYSTFDKVNFKKWLLVRFKINKMPRIHLAVRYMQSVIKLGVENDRTGLNFYIPEQDHVNLSNELAILENGYIGIVIGGNHHTKLLPVDKVISVCKAINLPIILLGGKEDKDRGDTIADAVGTNIINACGKYNLMQSASLVKQAAGIVTNDTGLMHIAAAFHKPMVSVWGNTVLDFGMYPYMPPGVPSMYAEVKNLKCRPCSKIGYKACPLKHFHCMRNQDVAAIAGFINDIKIPVS